MIPEQLRKKDYRFLRVKGKQKIPLDKGWNEGNNYTHDEKELEEHIKNNGNYGVATGYGQLLVIDFDDQEFQEALFSQLPRTFAVKTGSGGLHLYYKTDDTTSSKITTTEGKTLADIQGTGKQVIGAGSTHPNGNKYSVLVNAPITKIPRTRLNSILNTNGHKRRANGRMRKCPYHDDKNASLITYDDETFYCFGCQSSGTIQALNNPEQAKNKPNKAGGKHYYIQKKKEEKKIIIEIDERFTKPDLLKEINKELNKKHKLDEKEKVGLFIIRATAELPDPSDHVSAALKGDSAAGKDNAIKTILEQFPEEDSFFLTRGTQSALEEEAAKVKCVAFSEINKHREKGANSDITEFFKQLSEGGVKVIRRDQNTHEVINITTEQKTLLYGTTETESDEELETRYVIIPIKGSREKNQIVVKSYLQLLTEFKKSVNQESWIANSIRGLKQYDVKIPYAPALEEFFDLTKERVKRDVKRLFSLTKAVTWVYQKQRQVIKKEEGEFLLAEPEDFITVAEIFRVFLNSTYEGFDHRYNQILEAIKKRQGIDSGDILKLNYPIEYSDYAIKSKVIEDVGINKETFKTRLKWLTNENYVKTYYDRQLHAQISLIRVGEAVGVKSVLLGDTPTYTHALTHVLTHTKTREIYENKEFMGVIYKENEEKRDLPQFSPGEPPPGEILPGVSRSPDKILLPCSKCDFKGGCDYQDVKGRPVCEFCASNNEGLLD